MNDKYQDELEMGFGLETWPDLRLESKNITQKSFDVVKSPDFIIILSLIY